MTAKRNGAGEAPATLNSLVDVMQAPAANTFAISQRFAAEATKFWARRMRAYADQIETLASCNSPEEVAEAQTRFLERMREDYASEGQAIGAMLKVQPNGARRTRQHAAD